MSAPPPAPRATLSARKFPSANIARTSWTPREFASPKATSRLADSDIRLIVLDASELPPQFPAEVLQTFSPENTIAVVNKRDLPEARTEEFLKLYSKYNPVAVSCEKNEGIGNLREKMVSLAEANNITASADDILVSARHAAALERARAALGEAAKKIANSEAGELAASDLRESLDALGEIVGKTDCEQILDRVFSKFCIGK